MPLLGRIPPGIHAAFHSFPMGSFRPRGTFKRAFGRHVSMIVPPMRVVLLRFPGSLHVNPARYSTCRGSSWMILYSFRYVFGLLRDHPVGLGFSDMKSLIVVAYLYSSLSFLSRTTPILVFL